MILNGIFLWFSAFSRNRLRPTMQKTSFHFSPEMKNVGKWKKSKNEINVQKWKTFGNERNKSVLSAYVIHMQIIQIFFLSFPKTFHFWTFISFLDIFFHFWSFSSFQGFLSWKSHKKRALCFNLNKHTWGRAITCWPPWVIICWPEDCKLPWTIMWPPPGCCNTVTGGNPSRPWLLTAWTRCCWPLACWNIILQILSSDFFF